MTSYKDSGVDIEAGDAASKAAYAHAVSTFASRKGKIGEPVEEEDGYAGFLDMGDYYLVQSTDSTGTKVDIAAEMNTYDTLGYDLLAMVADDVVCVGAEVIALSNCIDVPKVDPEMIDALMSGLAKACSEQSIVIPAGEIAEVPGAVSRAVWSASAIGIVQKDRIVNTKLIQEGDLIIGLKSNCARSNGFSLIRKILTGAFGDNWYNEPWRVGNAMNSSEASSSWGDIMLSPSIVYHKAVHAVLEKVTVHGITHVTGGGIPSKLRRVLKESGLGASLDSLFDPHEALQDIVKLGSVPLEEAYKTWNMGNGMLIIIDPKDEDVVMNTLTAEGVTAQQVGRVTTESQISLQTYTGETVVFE